MLRQSIFLFLFCSCLTFSCTTDKEEPLTLSEEKMVMILLDAHILESALQDVSHNKRDTTKTKFYGQLYEIHGVSEKEFVDNVQIMEDQPKMLSRIYSKVMEEVSKLEADK